MENLKMSAWQESYQRQEHSILFPKEECIKFLSRFVRAKRADGSFIEKYLPAIKQLTGLDYGCGIGRQTQLMHEFNIDAQGVDIIDLAIKRAKQLYPDIADKFQQITPCHTLPFSDNQFDIVLVEAVLDSMALKFAQLAIKEIDRVTKGIVFISLISAKCNQGGGFIATDEEVTIAHEKGTIQSYYDQVRIGELLSDTSFKINWQTLHLHIDNCDEHVSNARYYLVLDNR